MTDTVSQNETHGDEPVLSEQDIALGLDKLNTATLAEQLEAQRQADAAADANETVVDAEVLVSEALTLEQELERMHGVQPTAEPTSEELQAWTESLMHEIDASRRFAEEGRFFARMTTQLVDLRQAQRVAQSIQGEYPTFLQDRRAAGQAELEIEALFDRARGCAGAVFSLLSAVLRTLEAVDPPGLRGPTPQPQQQAAAPPQPAQQPPTHNRANPMAPANRPPAPKPAVGPAPIPEQLRTRAPESDARQRVVEAQKRQEAERKRNLQKKGGATINPAKNRIAPQTQNLIARNRASGPVDARMDVQRDQHTGLLSEARRLMAELRRSRHNIDRSRITRFCESMVRLGNEGKVSDKLHAFARQVLQHQNAGNVVKLAAYFIGEQKTARLDV